MPGFAIRSTLAAGAMFRGAAAALLALGAVAAASSPSLAQEYYTNMTGPQCAARGGTIRVWTNTLRQGSGPAVGECYVPPRGAGSGAGYAPPATNSSANQAAAAVNAAAGVLGLLDSLGAFNSQSQAETEPEPPSAPAATAPQEPRIELAERNLERAARHNRLGKPCDAARFFSVAARQFDDAGEAGRQQDALFQASLSQADCDDERRHAVTQARASAPAPTASTGARDNAARKPLRLPRPTTEDGDDANVYWCPPEDGVYDMTRKGRYVRPGEGCGDRNAQRLPKPAEATGDDKFVYWCPNEDNVYGGGRYVKPGEGCSGPPAAPAKKKVSKVGAGGGAANTAGGGLSPEELKLRLGTIAKYRQTIAALPDGPQKIDALEELKRLEQSLYKK